MKIEGGRDRKGYCDWRFWKDGVQAIAGVDEVGRGPLAGPVIAAAVIFPPKVIIPGVTDSKCLKAPQREELFHQIRARSLALGLGMVVPKDIDRLNILRAALRAMETAVRNLACKPDLVLVDGNCPLQTPFLQQCLVKGDRLSHAIGAASVVAKVVRDKFMVSCHHRFPEYNFKNNKGYGTSEHLKALEKFGPCPIHRFSFRGVPPRGSKISEGQLPIFPG
jgi:ribonuclease HII